MASPTPRTPPWAWAALGLAGAGTLVSLAGAPAVLASNRDKPLRTPFWFAHAPFQGAALGLAALALVRPGLAAVPAVAAMACLTILQFAFEAAGTAALLPSRTALVATLGAFLNSGIMGGGGRYGGERVVEVLGLPED